MSIRKHSLSPKGDGLPSLSARPFAVAGVRTPKQAGERLTPEGRLRSVNGFNENLTSAAVGSGAFYRARPVLSVIRAAPSVQIMGTGWIFRTIPRDDLKRPRQQCVGAYNFRKPLATIPTTATAIPAGDLDSWKWVVFNTHAVQIGNKMC